MGGCFSNSNRKGLYDEDSNECATNFNARDCLTHHESKAMRMKRCVEARDLRVGNTVFLMWEELHHKDTYKARGGQVFSMPRRMHMGQKTVASITPSTIAFTDGYSISKYKIMYEKGVGQITHELCSGDFRAPGGELFRLVGMAKETPNFVLSSSLVF